jgi:non-canonical purine NTP pyrophosphatase (RdgB/HAM1 family)
VTAGRGTAAEPADRVLTREEAIRRFGPDRDFRLVFTNGCFDLLHRGHAAYLSAAAELGDRLVVGLNSDDSVRRLKGEGRPVLPVEDRAWLLASFRAVDAVTVFEEDTPLALIEALSPDVLVKGADYAKHEVVGREVVEREGGRVELVPLVGGRSTTRILERIRLAGDGPEEAVGTSRGPVADSANSERHPKGGRVLVATRSRHKLAEIRDLLGDLPFEFVSLADLGVEELPEEEGIEVYDTFAENAAAKARYFRRLCGLPTVADDSGLCVDALDGGPGVHTKRFAPEDRVDERGRDAANNRYLLERLDDVPPEERGAHYHCAAAVEADGASFVVHGQVHGRIAEEPRGEGGFGYDPLFLIPERGATFGELPLEVKQAMSHRARAFEKLRPWLMDRAEGVGG